MANAVRVLPALIAVSIGALAFKGVDVAQAVAQAAGEAKSEPAPETALTVGVGDHANPQPAATPAPAPAEGAPPADAAAAQSKTPDGMCIPAADYAEAGVSAQDIAVLRNLSERRQALDEREKALATREQLAAAAEGKLNDQIGGLKSLETEVNKLLAQMDAKRDKRMEDMVKTYEAMKPKDAANIFNNMDDQVLLDLAKGMKPATLGPIMAVMDVKRAQSLTKMIAALAAPPTAVDALKQAAAAPS